MRWIFFTLVVLNFAYLFWGGVNSGSDTVNSSKEKLPELRGEKLVLVTERPSSSGRSVPPPAAKVESKPKTESVQVPVPLSSPESVAEVADVDVVALKPAPIAETVEVPVVEKESMCTSIGPFITKRDGELLVRSLESEGYKATVQSLELSREIQFWVMLPPYPNKIEALQVLKQLQTKNIDSYLMATGAMKNAISLGLFNRESSAKGVLDRIQTAGFAAEIRQQERVEREFWVRMPPGQAVEKLQETLETLVSSEAQAKISSASCEMFALTQ